MRIHRLKQEAGTALVIVSLITLFGCSNNTNTDQKQEETVTTSPDGDSFKKPSLNDKTLNSKVDTTLIRRDSVATKIKTDLPHHDKKMP